MWLDVAFGPTQAGLGTVGYRQVDNTGGDAVARTDTGVVEIGQGAYGVEVTIDPDAVSIEWDTGGGTPIYAHENLNLLGEIVEGSTTRKEALKLMLGVWAGKLSGAGTTEETFRDFSDTLDRVVATVDDDGNRSDIVTILTDP